MRRYDLLDEYATVIAPHLGPQARSRPRPAGNLKPAMRKAPVRKAPVPKLWPAPVAPVALLAIGIVLLVAS